MRKWCVQTPSIVSFEGEASAMKKDSLLQVKRRSITGNGSPRYSPRGMPPKTLDLMQGDTSRSSSFHSSAGSINAEGTFSGLRTESASKIMMVSSFRSMALPITTPIMSTRPAPKKLTRNDEDDMGPEDKANQRAALAFLKGATHESRAGSLAGISRRTRSTFARGTSHSQNKARKQAASVRPLVFRGTLAGGQEVKRSNDMQELNMVAACFRRMTSDATCVFGHGLGMGDATMLAALASFVRLDKRERFCREGEVGSFRNSPSRTLTLTKAS